MKSLRSLLAAGFAASVLTVTSFAADANGTWKWSTPGRDGQTREATLKIETKEGKLTGVLSGMRGETPVSDIVVKDDTIDFSVTREMGGNKWTSKYHGKIEGDAIKGTIEMPGRDGGEPRKVDWNATRAK
jgi:hypothetical protein